MSSKIQRNVFSLVLAIIGVQVFASSGASANLSFICTYDEEVREIHVIYEIEGQSLPCSVLYRQPGSEEVLWNALHEEGYCEEKAKAFVEKQRQWGWTCQQPVKDEAAEELVDEATSSVDEDDFGEEVDKEVVETSSP